MALNKKQFLLKHHGNKGKLNEQLILGRRFCTRQCEKCNFKVWMIWFWPAPSFLRCATLFLDPMGIHHVNGFLAFQRLESLVRCWMMMKLNVWSYLKLPRILNLLSRDPWEFVRALVWRRSSLTMTLEFVEVFCINSHHAGDHTPLAMSTSIAFNHHLLQLDQAGPTSGLAPLGSLALRVAISDDLKIKIQPLKAVNLMPTAFDMFHQLSWSLESNCVLQARTSSWQPICFLMRSCSLDTPKVPEAMWICVGMLQFLSLMISPILLQAKDKMMMHQWNRSNSHACSSVL